MSGQPIPAGSQVVFFCDSAKATARGILNDEGTFTLSAQDPFLGIPAGQYHVMIRPADATAMISTRSERENATKDGLGAIPKKFQAFATSGMVFDVDEGTNIFEIDLADVSP